jgi:predicted 3-demethylubiquinone-9 3-methyltransferase (glyoxalase superfamily)
MTPKNTVCLWFDEEAEEAARFYAATFPNSRVIAVSRASGDDSKGRRGKVLTVEFTVFGIPCLGLNGGPHFKHSEAFSFQIATDHQEETDRYWNAIIANGGKESDCGWCQDRWGISWQITPRALMDALAAGGDEATRAFDAMMTMRKIDVARIEAARRGHRGARFIRDYVELLTVEPQESCAATAARRGATIRPLELALPGRSNSGG